MDSTLKSALAAVASQFSAYKEAEAGLDKTRKRKERLERLIERHQKALKNLGALLDKARERANSIDPRTEARYLAPLAEAVLTQFPGMKSKIMGPFGLANQSSITIFDPALGENEGGKGSLMFRFDDERGLVGYVDYSRNTEDFPPKSLGAVNGLNHPVVLLTEETSLEALAALFRRSA